MALSKCVANQSFGATPGIGKVRPTSVDRDVLIRRGVHCIAYEGLDIGDTVDDAPSNLHVCGTLTGPPLPLQGAMRNGPAFRQFFLVQADWFHHCLLARNSQRLQEDEGVKEKDRQVSVVRCPAQRCRDRGNPSKRPARMRESNRIGRYSRRNVACGPDLNLPTERSFCVSLSVRLRGITIGFTATTDSYDSIWNHAFESLGRTLCSCFGIALIVFCSVATE